MRIAVIGAGNVGGTLGRRWATLGHTVAFGVRRPAKGQTTPSEAARGAELVLFAIPWNAVPEALAELGADGGALDGVVLVDATNPLGPGLKLLTGPQGESGGERLQALVPRARVVKAFNTTGYENMASPAYGGEPTAMFYAGDDSAAKETVRGLIVQLGFEPIDAGPLARSRELEHLAALWVALAMGVGTARLGRDIAFRLMRRP